MTFPPDEIIYFVCPAKDIPRRNTLVAWRLTTSFVFYDEKIRRMARNNDPKSKALVHWYGSSRANRTHFQRNLTTLSFAHKVTRLRTGYEIRRLGLDKPDLDYLLERLREIKASRREK
jgi:hypothetical protein